MDIPEKLLQVEVPGRGGGTPVTPDGGGPRGLRSPPAPPRGLPFVFLFQKMKHAVPAVQNAVMAQGSIQGWVADPYRQVLARVTLRVIEDHTEGPRKVQVTKEDADTALGLAELAKVCRAPIKGNQVIIDVTPPKTRTRRAPTHRSIVVVLCAVFDNVSTRHPGVHVEAHGCELALMGRVLLFKTLVANDNSLCDVSLPMPEVTDMVNWIPSGQSEQIGPFSNHSHKFYCFSCVACGKPARKKCAQCLMARYCGMQCHVADWKRHKQACACYTLLPLTSDV